jgi:hypothetical protein
LCVLTVCYPQGEAHPILGPGPSVPR